jgi:solute carrier family 25 protein 34/35
MASRPPAPPAPPAPLAPLRLGVLPSFAASAVAACSACVFTNPMEVIKTRLQLDGEGAGRAAGGARQYRGIGHALTSIAAAEGVRGLQAGLTPALAYQVTMNGCRLGLYEPAQAALREYGGVDTSAPAAKAGAGAASGAVGAALGSPMYLVKSRLQAQSAFFKAREAHAYAGMADAFRQIYAAEGVRGLFRGVDGALPRVMCGSATQLASYDSAKAWVAGLHLLPPGTPQHLAASCLASLLTVTVMNPLGAWVGWGGGVQTWWRGVGRPAGRSPHSERSPPAAPSPPPTTTPQTWCPRGCTSPRGAPRCTAGPSTASCRPCGGRAWPRCRRGGSRSTRGWGRTPCSPSSSWSR